MSLPTPIDLLVRLRKFLGSVVFAIGVLLIMVPIFRWVLIIAGALLLVGHHWVWGGLLVVLGLIGAFVEKNIRF